MFVAAGCSEEDSQPRLVVSLLTRYISSSNIASVVGVKPKYHGGPVSKLALSESSARRRGLKQSGDTPKLNPVKIIVRDGVIVNPRAFKRLRPAFPVASLVTAGERAGQAGAPAKTNPQSALRDLDARERDNR